MKRSTLITLFAVATALLAGSALAAQAPRHSLASQLSVAKSYFPVGDHIAVTFTLRNTGDASLWVLSWQLPSEEMDADLLDVRLDGNPAAYVGRIVKRAPPVGSDYVQLKPGHAFVRVFDPSAAYDMTAAGEYTLRYRGTLVGVLDKAPDRTTRPIEGEMPHGATLRAGSNAVGFACDGIPNDLAVYLPETIGGYTKCTTSQQSTMQTSHNNAISISGKAKAQLAANPNGSTLYTYWFGAYASSRFSTVVSHYNAINGAFVSKSVTYDCGCKKSYYAYVYPNQPYKIYVCKVFWSAPALGRDSKAGTLVHEMSHFYVTASTDDWVYGASGAHNLAVTNPTNAIDNADNHEYFAEDSP